MNWRVIESKDEFQAAAGPWNNLVEQGVTPFAYLRHEWFDAWWQAYGADRRLFIVVVENAGEWQAVAPCLRAPRRVGPWKVNGLEFLANELSPRCELILRRPEVELVEAITAALKAARNKWDLARLEVIAGRSLTHCLLPQALRNAGLAYDTLHRASLPILVINGSWEEYWRQLSYSGRRILARSRKKCRAAGALEVLRLNDPTGVAAWLNGLMDIADRSWKKPLGTDMRTRPENAAFYSDMLMRLAGAGGLAVWLLRINGFPAAMQICLRERDRVILMRSDFDEQFRSLEVGHALLGKVLEDCFALGLKEYDFGTQEYQYKRQFATRVDPMFAYEVYSGQTRLSGVRMAKKIMRRLRLLRQRMGIQGELLVRDVRPTEEEAKPMRLKTR